VTVIAGRSEELAATAGLSRRSASARPLRGTGGGLLPRGRHRPPHGSGTEPEV